MVEGNQPCELFEGLSNCIGLSAVKVQLPNNEGFVFWREKGQQLFGNRMQAKELEEFGLGENSQGGKAAIKERRGKREREGEKDEKFKVPREPVTMVLSSSILGTAMEVTHPLWPLRSPLSSNVKVMSLDAKEKRKQR